MCKRMIIEVRRNVANSERRTRRARRFVDRSWKPWCLERGTRDSKSISLGDVSDLFRRHRAGECVEWQNRRSRRDGDVCRQLRPPVRCRRPILVSHILILVPLPGEAFDGSFGQSNDSRTFRLLPYPALQCSCQGYLSLFRVF